MEIDSYSAPIRGCENGKKKKDERIDYVYMYHKEKRARTLIKCVYTLSNEVKRLKLNRRSKFGQMMIWKYNGSTTLYPELRYERIPLMMMMMVVCECGLPLRTFFFFSFFFSQMAIYQMYIESIIL